MLKSVLSKDSDFITLPEISDGLYTSTTNERFPGIKFRS